jgi:hypothetical protein
MKIIAGLAAVVIVLGLGIVGMGPGATTVLGQGGMPSEGMGGMMGGMGMMGGPFSPSARPITMDRAIRILRAWPAAHNLDGLVLDEVEAYTQNFYGQFTERATGRGAIQVLVDRYSGRAMPEMGPNMMWNTKYGRAMMQDMMGGMGMMGGGGMMMGGQGMMGGGMMQGTPATPQPGAAPAAGQISEAQARRDANQFLGGYLPGATVGDGDTFYGYYHFDVMGGGRQVGMLSVNATTGQVWYHTWHGEFLGKREVAHP